MLDPDHLIELAGDEARAPSAGRPRQANLSPAISTAYYAVFHQLLRAAAVLFVPQSHWKSRVLFYRSREHGRIRDRRKKPGQNPLPPGERAFLGFEAFSAEIRLFATEFVSLRELRHVAGYDPESDFTSKEAQDAVAAARKAIANLPAAPDEMMFPFLSYLLIGLRR